MIPPEAPAQGSDAAGETPPAVSVCPGITTLTRRADFLRAARGRHARMPGLFLQARQRAPGEAEGIRVGYTCSRKVGNAVARNRARRRLREAARAVLPCAGQAGWDYVLVGRAGATAGRPFHALTDDLRAALARVHGERP